MLKTVFEVHAPLTSARGKRSAVYSSSTPKITYSLFNSDTDVCALTCSTADVKIHHGAAKQLSFLLPA